MLEETIAVAKNLSWNVINETLENVNQSLTLLYNAVNSFQLVAGDALQRGQLLINNHIFFLATKAWGPAPQIEIYAPSLVAVEGYKVHVLQHLVELLEERQPVVSAFD